MSIHDLRPAPKRTLLALGLLVAQAFACSGGNDFTSVNMPDGSVTEDSGGHLSIVANPNDDSGDTNTVPPGMGDATAGLPVVDASSLDGTSGGPGSGDAGSSDAPGPDALVCPSMDLACDGGCIANDVHNCGGCGAVCAGPVNGVPLCAATSSGHACGILCNGTLTHCGSVCTDLKSDANNCGTCGRTCGPGKCSAGICQSWVIDVESTPVPADGFAPLATDGTRIEWISGGFVKDAPVAGGASITLGPRTGANQIYSVAMASSVVAWMMTDSGGQGIDIETAKAGVLVGTTSPSAPYLIPNSSNCTPRGLALTPNGMAAYFGLECAGATQIFVCSLSTVACNPLGGASGGAGDNLVAFANNIVFWTDVANGNIWRYRIATQQADELATNQGGPFRLAVDSDHVYWASKGAAGTVGMYRAMQSGALNGETTVVAPLSGTLRSIAADGTNLYFAASLQVDGGSGGDQVDYEAVGGTSPLAALPNPNDEYPFGVTTAAGYVFWIALNRTSGDVTIYGLRFP
jgi:hypothetical protein